MEIVWFFQYLLIITVSWNQYLQLPVSTYVLSSFLLIHYASIIFTMAFKMPLSSSFYSYSNISFNSFNMAQFCIRKANWLNQATPRVFVSERQFMSLWGICSFTLSGKNIGAKRFSLSHTNWHHCSRPNCGIKGRTFPEKESIFFSPKFLLL